MINEFTKFLKEHNVISLAIAVVMGTASTALVKSLVNDVFMPVLAPILSSDSWKEAVLNFGPVHIAIGSFASELFNFVILAFIIFIVAKKILKTESTDKK
jgi:large conductance mechanosensitive channel